ncbi:hypothetical protein QF035_009108 [Streptomyces umbrinus]|uniref:Uncharacterized protein n=1 Tax=Streptomyces umbrinus TaxID=67370 RepID=A0ABU0T999_9ACTN|nr:hypothetical protein [Streptomyces umbrinus]
MAQVPGADGNAYRVVGVLGGPDGAVGDHEGQVEAAGSAAVRAQEPVQIGRYPQHLAPCCDITGAAVGAHGMFDVFDQRGQPVVADGDDQVDVG